jgi:hypothetical protein
MNKIKVFTPEINRHLQEEIDRWVEEENPIIISVTPSIALNQYGSSCIVTVLYEENFSFNDIDGIDDNN